MLNKYNLKCVSIIPDHFGQRKWGKGSLSAKETGYDGWYSMDQYPYREDGQGAVRESVRFLQMIEARLTDTIMEEIRELQRKGDAVESQRWLRETFFK